MSDKGIVIDHRSGEYIVPKDAIPKDLLAALTTGGPIKVETPFRPRKDTIANDVMLSIVEAIRRIPQTANPANFLQDVASNLEQIVKERQQ